MASKAIYPGRELSNLRGCGGVRSEFCPVCEFTRDWYVICLPSLTEKSSEVTIAQLSGQMKAAMDQLQSVQRCAAVSGAPAFSPRGLAALCKAIEAFNAQALNMLRKAGKGV
eukprot:s2801_g18.t1